MNRILNENLRSSSYHRFQVERLEERSMLAGDVAPLIDLNTTPSSVSSSPGNIVDVGGVAFFTATTNDLGVALFKSNGSEAGTELVWDIKLKADRLQLLKLTNVNGTLYFYDNDGIHGYELWKSDGTTAGTGLLKDIKAGPGGSLQTSFAGDVSFPSELVNVNGTLFFKANDGASGAEIWKSDGTSTGTVLVKDVMPNGRDSSLDGLTNVNGTLFFTADDGINGDELWKSDGTQAGTALVKDIQPGFGGSTPSNIANVNGTLFFSALDGSTGIELWKSDGTQAGTLLVRDVANRSLSPSQITDVSGTAFFVARDSSGQGYEMWKSNGTASGTVLVKTLYTQDRAAAISSLVNVSGTLYFRAKRAGTGNYALWKSDGTSTGTVSLSEFSASADSSPANNYTNVNGTLYFFEFAPSLGTELWKSNGTVAGTVLVKDIRPGQGSSIGGLANVNGTLYFRANDGFNGVELWKSDIADGAVLVKDIRTGTQDSNPKNFANVNGILYFTTDVVINGGGLWKTDGTPNGTVLLKGGDGQGFGDIFTNLTNFSGMLYFTVSKANSTSELWKSDGTTAGTVLVRNNLISPQSFSNVNGTLLFQNFSSSTGSEWWKTDGTSAGTTLLKDINPGASGIGPINRVIVNNTVYFVANDGVSGFELWKSDGTASGTVLVKDIRNGASNSDTYNLVNVNGVLYFSANDGLSGSELWKSDGTQAGTVRVQDIVAGIGGSFPRNLTNVNGSLFFASNDGLTGFELWKSDGTTSGTTLVKDIFSGVTSSLPSLPIVPVSMNGKLFFWANDGINGFELWKSDGTEAGTSLVKNIRAGNNNSDISNLVNANGTLYFRANDGTSGNELWRSDGTELGTSLALDVAFESISSTPISGYDSMGLIGSKLFFGANTSKYGTELYAFETNQSPTNIAMTQDSIPENQVSGTSVGAFNTTDPDTGNSFSYSLVSGVGDSDNAKFTIGTSGNLVTAATFNFEVLNSYSIRVRTTDQGGLFFEKSFTINVTDVNEPVVLTRDSASVIGNVLTQLTNTGTWSDPESGSVTLSASLGTVTKNANGTWSWAYTPNVALLGQAVTISANDGTNVSSVTFNVTAYSTIATRGLVYVGATGASASTSLATDKQALLPGQTSTFANYTNYSLGLNSLVIDVAGLPATVTNSQLAASLQFANWDGIAAAGFVALPGAAVPTVAIVAGGVVGSTRVGVTFPNNSLQNTWLRVTVLANSDTSLAANDVFYFGNVIGDLNIGNTASRLRVNGQDTGLMLLNQSPGINSASVTNIFDLNRDGRVNGLDTGILMANQQAGGVVAPITAPSARTAARGSLNLSGVGASGNRGGNVAPLPSLGAATESTKDTSDRRESQNLAVGISNGLLEKTLVSRGGEASTSIDISELSGTVTNSGKETKKGAEQIFTELDSIFASFWGRV